MAELELRHLRTVCAIAETGSLTRAAARLGLTQPALSAQLRCLETIMGGTLFERSSTGSTLTALGRHVVGTARTVLDDVEQLVDLARDQARAEEREPVVVGAVPASFVGRLAARLRGCLPVGGVRTRTVVSSARLWDELAAGRVQVAVLERGTETSLPDVEVFPLVDEPQFVALAAHDPLARRAEVELRELADRDWVVPLDERNGLRPPRRAVCAAAGFVPRRTHRVDDGAAAWSLVERGAVCFAAPTAPATADVVLRPLAGPLVAPLVLAVRVDGVLAGRAGEVYRCAAAACASVIGRNPDHAGWWADHPEAPADLDGALRAPTR
ncbi:DNA-binding transcriptional regulator, LysR family [Amycolatopsis arida]|uniref:DNA-binding transcriptional regulator, LysR family n=1 Tax=Amycolatopsis arida TaxID=587909 RepID=A0A1I5LGJ2_9PSEU|nr:LysR family transcriptional regulator [Amycolatopsis arida]TDX93715.1 DNA-binding transcriptional LysR family regulator [Amycolatopsis arida]SFO96420.1 DNA-binding transcriptional regulator, LysR family [Amycolatopsis arida]